MTQPGFFGRLRKLGARLLPDKGARGRGAGSTVKIYSQQYALPEFPVDRLTSLHKRVRQRQVAITRSATNLQPEERFKQTELLVSDYEHLQRSLTSQAVAYEDLLDRITRDVRRSILEECQRILSQEEELKKFEARAVRMREEGAKAFVKNGRERLGKAVRRLGYSAVLIAKKLDLFRSALERMKEDQELQALVLADVTDRITLHRDMFRLDREIRAIEQDAEQMAQVAIEFEELMQECFGPLQTVIEDVISLDFGFVDTIDEIQHLTQMIQADAQQFDTQEVGGNDLVDFLVASQLRGDRLRDVLQSVDWHEEVAFDYALKESAGSDGEAEVSTAIANVKTWIHLRLQPAGADAPVSEQSERHPQRKPPDTAVRKHPVSPVPVAPRATQAASPRLVQDDRERLKAFALKHWTDYVKCSLCDARVLGRNIVSHTDAHFK